MKHLILAVFALGTLSHASGWLCKSTNPSNQEFHVKLYNRIDATRIPHILIVSEKTLGTILKAKDEAIEKHIMGFDTFYSAQVAEAEQGWESAEFQIPYREGVDKPLKHGATLNGELVLTNGEDSLVTPLLCRRYLKGY